MSLRRSRLRAGSVLAVCLAALAPATAGAVADPYGRQNLQRQLEEFVRSPGGPPGAIAVLRTEEGTRVVRAGVADIRTGRPPRPDDHMRIASTAKAFSGAVALTLVHHRVLRLDDTLHQRLPQLPDAWGEVTLRQLLNHTSGLPDYSRSAGFLDELRADPRHRFDSRRLLDYVADQPLLFAPGSEYRYSNSDNIAVALMAEAATRTPYEELLRRLVYRPLGLHSTSLPQGYRMPKPYLHGYDVDPPAPPEDVSEVIGMSGVWASGGIVSTPADMTRFIRGYASGRLYGRKVVEQQRRWIEGAASEPAGPGRNSAGLAVFRYQTRCGVVLGHTGNTLGYTQLIAATPDGRRSLTFSVTSQITETTGAERLREMRALQENFVCALLRGKGE
ncbi:serine hydrolase domain-containing protein [Streptomyces griseorubiginosus]|uniref:serine hydrolase domain-containing protein n=1 Tax=Streptomyces griseorubiginosus TaxID=67304 RepID=UPI002E80D1ED|nr:serine hydrolase domain-containing protein [Streptomyces griseorubiginosus]WUB42163.1 beta-lactamase family protein [Streptomyces griseorubiginosus]WUB50682.1 beta-lactamase family protein [Streptomyces griseorubiginosus]